MGREKSVAEIVNLKRARKGKARQAREREAEANRLRFGRTKAQKLVDRQARERLARDLEDKKLE